MASEVSESDAATAEKLPEKLTPVYVTPSPEASRSLKTTKHGIVLVPQPTEDPDEPLVTRPPIHEHMFLKAPYITDSLLELELQQEACGTRRSRS